jgi:hypothetical protein
MTVQQQSTKNNLGVNKSENVCRPWLRYLKKLSVAIQCKNFAATALGTTLQACVITLTTINIPEKMLKYVYNLGR